MIDRRTWKEFKDNKLLWWVNRTLHLFGWAIVLEQNENGDITCAYPARVTFRGFSEQSEETGFMELTAYLKNNIDSISKDVD